MHYRRDIDGLRAVAVLAILAFHAGLPLRGGYLGVDVFLVISGFLITSIIEREVGDGSFTLLGFYRRRVVRILPALLLMLIVTCLVGTVILLPGELRALANSAAAAAGFGSNIFFWREAAYFGGMAEARPLLHTWSLGVEEQFYLLYPLLLIAAFRWLRPAGVRWLMLAAVVGSLALRWRYGDSNPVPVFYLLPGRVWELGLGALAALSGAAGSRPTGPAGQMLGWAGLLLIAASLAGASPDVPGQGWAIAACAGTTLILLCGRGGSVGAVLSVAPLRAIGMASYSIYLWHWPVLSLYRTVYGNELTLVETAALIAVALILAALSFRFVETPFRRRYATAAAVPVVLIGMAASAAVIGGALLLARNADVVRQLPPEVRRVAAYSDYWKHPRPPTPLERRCAEASASGARPAACPAETSDDTVLLVGDSHAQHIADALRYRFPASHIIPVVTKGCRSLIEDPPSRCSRRFDRAIRALVTTGKVRAVVLAAQWRVEDIAPLVRTIRVLRSHQARVTVIGPVVEYDGDFPRLLARALLRHDLPSVDTLRRRSRQALDRQMALAVDATGARYFSAYDRECPGGRCRLFSSRGEPMHFDYGHYTRSASVDIIAGLPQL